MTDVNGIAGDRLKSYLERIERLEVEKAERTEDIKEVYIEVKSAGFDAKILRKIVSMRKKDREQLQEEETLLDLYCRALDMAAPLPLFKEAAE